MSETAILTLVTVLWGVIQLGAAGILGWIAMELRGIRQDLDTKVEKNDCDAAMCRHYSEIQNIWKKTHDNTELIARLEK